MSQVSNVYEYIVFQKYIFLKECYWIIGTAYINRYKLPTFDMFNPNIEFNQIYALNLIKDAHIFKFNTSINIYTKEI